MPTAQLHGCTGGTFEVSIVYIQICEFVHINKLQRASVRELLRITHSFSVRKEGNKL
jgi:hypothetical protein